jgi:iron complex outermembrane recepter protein
VVKKLNLLACAWSLIIGYAWLGVAQAAEAQAPVPESAQAASQHSDTDLAEIIVTATRRAETLKTVPISVTAFSAASIAARGITNVENLASSVPNLTVGPAAASQNAAIIDIRGQVQRDPIETLDPTVGVYVDDVYLARAYSALNELLDVDRVEVLRGPQGTLFGRNTIGGAISVISRKPKVDEGLTGTVFVGVGDYNLREIGGAVTIPIVNDRLAIRYAGNLRTHDGYTNSYLVTEPYAGPSSVLRKIDTNDQDLTSQRISVAWHPTDTTKIDANYYYFSDHSNGPLFSHVYGDIVRTSLTTLVTTASNSPQRAADFYSALTNVAPFSRTRSQIASMTLQQEITNDITFKAIGSYSKSKNHTFNNGDGLVTDSIALLTSEPELISEQSQYTGELQLSGSSFDHFLDWIGGVYYFTESAFEGGHGNAKIFGSDAGAVQYTGTADNKSKSAYLSLTAHPTSRLAIRAGARYTEDTKGIDGHNRNDPTQICLYTPGPGIITSTTSGGLCSLQRTDKFGYWIYDVGLDYKITNDIFVYAKTGDGYRSGGEQLRAVNTASSVPFSPDKVINYEGGVKATWFDRLTTNAAVFHVDYSDVQQTSLIGPPNAPIFTSFTVNQGRAKVDGFEIEGSLQLFKGFRLDAAVGHAHFKFEKPGQTQIFAPEWKYSISGSYAQGIGSATLTTSVNFDKTSSYAVTDIQTGSPNDAPVDGPRLLGARIALLLKGGLEFSLWGRNLTGNHYYSNAYEALNIVPGTVGDPRTYGATARYSF